MANVNKLSIALLEFREKYPNITSADLQSFILGWQAAEKSYSLPAMPKNSQINIKDYINLPKECIHGWENPIYCSEIDMCEKCKTAKI
jgi:hypothetical protein